MRKKITVVGGGNVGASCAVNLALKELGDVVLVGHEVQRDRARLLGRQRLLGEGDELAVNARPEHITRLDVEIRRAALRRAGLADCSQRTGYGQCGCQALQCATGQHESG